MNKRPIGITIIAWYFIIIAPFSLLEIGKVQLFMGFRIDGIFSILLYLIYFSVDLFIGIGFLKLKLLAWKIFFVNLIIGMTSMVLGIVFYSFEERMAILGYMNSVKINQYKLPVVILAVTYIGLIILATIYVYRKKGFFKVKLPK